MKRFTSPVLEKGEIVYLGYRPDMKANLYAVRSIDGKPPIPLGQLLAAAPNMLQTLKEELEALLVWQQCRYHLPADIREVIGISIDKIQRTINPGGNPL